ncbi:disease resistance protein At4g27190-like [Solanum verrucosum]|uniref:disease resistance protein At4g27190-like n=1 Tax=Solanum verrucosum TaxID=315347 RepID=UPI0020D032BA|nr:disease resistance protein At4g27190-like [Solanum verrucosum]
MDILFNVVGGFVVEVGKFVCKCIYPKIENIVRFSSKIENLKEEMEKLTKFRNDIKGKMEEAEGEGYKPKLDVIKWLEDVCELQKEWESMQDSIATAKTLAYKCCPKCSLRSEVSTQAQKIQDQLHRLKQIGESFGSNLVVENYQIIKVEFIPGTSIEGQSAATKNLNKILRLLEDDKVCIIGVWGTGGVGKTSLVNNLNNKLLKTDVSSFKLSFGVVIWVTVPKPPIDIRNVQTQIASRLNLKVDKEGNVKSNASKIYKRLKQEKSFLLILDDVWEAINLDDVGVPQPEPPARSKVIITSRSLAVCKQMKIDTEMKVYTLDEDESWQLFVKNAGDVANLVDIQPLAKEITRECDGLPLAITVIGTSMRGKTKVELWEDALKSLRMSEPHNKDVTEKVYEVIKWSFDSLESQDNELYSKQRSKHVKNKRGDIRSCFLYCSLYPAAISTEDLIKCWWAEGFLGVHDTYEEAYNRGITIIDSLKDACLVEEAHKTDCVKMHDVVRDVAIWIDNSFGLTDISHIEMSASVKRISLLSKEIQSLPDNFRECPETTTLLLQDNDLLSEIPREFFFAFPALRVLNLSETGIKALPCSINILCQLRALILRNCYDLNKLPPIGNLFNLELFDCDNTRLCCLPQGMDKLTNLRLLNLPVDYLEESISHGFFLKLPRIEILNMLPTKTRDVDWMMRKNRVTLLVPTSFDEISSLHNLTSLFINLDNSSILIRDHTWMKRLKRFHIEIGETSKSIPFNKSRKMISISHCETFSNGELSGMLHFASHLHLLKCGGLRKLIANNSFDRLKSLHIESCSCDFTPAEEGNEQFDDPLPNLEHLSLFSVHNLKSVSDFGQLLGLRFSGLRQLEISSCRNLTCLFIVGGYFSVPKHLEEVSVAFCHRLTELLVQCSSSQMTLFSSEIPRVRKLRLKELPKLKTLREPWYHIEELKLINCYEITELPFSIQTSNKIRLIKGTSEWWNLLEWDDINFKSNLEHCFLKK